MKNLYLRSCIALLCAASVVACGGDGNLQLGGSVTGLTKSGLELTNNDNAPFAVALRPNVPNFPFAFPQLIGTDSNYNVRVSKQPDGAVCTIADGTGSGRASSNVSSVRVECITNRYDLGGTVNGNIAGLELINAPEILKITENGAFVFATKVPDGDPYNVLIFTQPTNGLQCSISNGSGRMGTAPITDVVVNCPVIAN